MVKQQTTNAYQKTTAVVAANAAKVIKSNKDTRGIKSKCGDNDTARKWFVHKMHEMAYELYRRSFAVDAMKTVSVTFKTMVQKNHLEVKIQLTREKGELSIDSTVNHFLSADKRAIFCGDMKDVLSKKRFFHLVSPTIKKAIELINTALAFACCGIVGSSSKKSTPSSPIKRTEEPPSTFKLLAGPMHELSDQVMKFVTENFPHPLTDVERKGRLECGKISFADKTSKGVWGGCSRYQWAFDSIVKKYIPDVGPPPSHMKTKSIMLVYALLKVEHEYYNNGFGNLDIDREYGCPVVASEDDEFKYDYWKILQFLHSVSPSARKVMMILKQRHEEDYDYDDY